MSVNPLIPERPSQIVFPDTPWGMEALRGFLLGRFGPEIELRPGLGAGLFGMEVSAAEADASPA